MKTLKRRMSSPADESGAALILALIIVAVIGVAGAAVLSFSDTSIRTTVALRDQGARAYAADGAAQVAINSLRTGYGFETPELFTNADGTTCFGKHGGTLNLPDFYPAAKGQEGAAPTSASVECSADPKTGENGTVVPITSANRPAGAILTLGQTSEDGIFIKALGKPGDFAVKGSVSSSSNINVDHGTLQSTAAVTAFGGCSGSIVSTPDPLCDTKKAPDDPDYAAAATEVPAYQAVPPDREESCPKGVVTFEAGYYDDAASLNALMSGKACSGSTWWFTPGTYYFDFHNNDKDSDFYQGPVKNEGQNPDQWSIKTGHLVAGTPTDSDGNVSGSPGPSPTFPGSCQSPIKSKNAKGVQFIFGGDSQLTVEGSADAEICGTYSAKRPPIALFGVKADEAKDTTLEKESALKMSDVSEKQAPFVNPTQILEEDGKSATWDNDSDKAATATITGSGYAPPDPIPAGSIVKSASIRVRHGNSEGYSTKATKGKAKDSLSVLFTPTGEEDPMTLALEPKQLKPGVDLETELIDLPPEFANLVHDKGFTGASVAYTANLTHKGTESLDAIQIDISYVAPAFRSQDIKKIDNNCMTLSGSKGCAVLSTSESFKGAFYVQGTTYTPRAAIELTLNNATQQVLRFGVISRSFSIKQTGSFDYSGPVIEVPDDTTGGNGSPVVLLTVYVCPATTTDTCSDQPSKIALTVKALIDDSGPSRRIKILSWSVQR